MVVIFGWGSGPAQDLGEVAPTTCPRCHNQVFLHHIKSDKKVSLYFVPLAQYGSSEYLACPICKAGMEIGAGQRQAVVQMHANTLAFRRRAMSIEAYQPIVDRFWQSIGVDPSGQQVLRPAAAIPPAVQTSARPGSDTAPPLADQLAGLARLHTDGVLTDEEFSAAKRRLLEP